MIVFSLAGYVAVILGAQKLDRIFPMMMTPAGTIPPVKVFGVFVIGAGVAGLQAIATAKRLGARVEAFDTRTVVEEQVISLGAKFVKVDLGETGQNKDGYANALTSFVFKFIMLCNIRAHWKCTKHLCIAWCNSWSCATPV